MSNANRQREFRKRMEEQGFVQVTGWVPASQMADVQSVMRRLRDDGDLEIGTLRNTRTGRAVRK